MARALIWLLFFILFLENCSTRQETTGIPDEIDFNFHVKPILSDRCFACHGPDKNQRKADLRLDTEEGLFHKKTDNGGYAFVPGNLKKSEAFQRLTAHDTSFIMPPPESNLTLAPAEINVIRRWIEQGASYKPHWAFSPTAKPSTPKIKNKNWPINPIDHFVLAKIEQQGMAPTTEASKEMLLRRVYLDITGLPPSLKEIDTFLKDNSPDAYEKVVDRLLQSPEYGERMALDWLDLARFADTYGYTVDRYRDVSPWRDWVIEAFNNNMPYDTFVTWQLAGDLLPKPSKDQFIATAFNRLHPQNAEGGIVSEEFRVEYVADRTETFGTAFLGMTFKCARCHDHKYDPIEQKEYYSLYSFFNNVDDSGQITFSTIDMPAPTMLLTNEEVEERLTFLQSKVDSCSQLLEQDSKNAQTGFEKWLKTPGNKGTGPFPKGLVAHYGFDEPEANHFQSSTKNASTGILFDPVDNVPVKDRMPVAKGVAGNAVGLNGDEAIAFKGLGRFLRAQPFSIGLWVKVPEDLTSGVIFHGNKGGIIFNFKGYQLSIEEGRLDVRLAHAFPYNSIHLVSRDTIVKEDWFHVLLSYDGSSDASGVHLYYDGRQWPLQVKRNHLYKEMAFTRENIDTYLKVGARWRTRGLKGAWVDELVVFDRALTPLEAKWIYDRKNPIPALAGQAIKPAPETRQGLFEYYLATQDKSYSSHQRDILQARSDLHQAIEPVQELMVTAEMPEPRPTFVLERGQYNVPKEQVFPATPEHILRFPAGLPKNRLGLAQWLFHKDNPLPARVAINRIWQQFFGSGLVETSEDFGNQGALPSHPELLDWLAIAFRESGWDLKYMVKLIVMSATYRQSSIADEAQAMQDPSNRWLARGPVKRLNAEHIRDHALHSSGLLVKKIGGPSVKPYQPADLWRFNGGKYTQDHGDSLYRRSLYTFVKRTVPPPTMSIFDAPDRSYCISRRQNTKTPLQALTLMNDPQFLEAARVLAHKAIQQPDLTESISFIYQSLTGIPPTIEEQNILQNLFEKSIERFEANPNKMKGLLHTGEYPLPQSIDSLRLAGLAMVAGTVMNSDGFVVCR